MAADNTLIDRFMRQNLLDSGKALGSRAVARYPVIRRDLQRALCNEPLVTRGRKGITMGGSAGAISCPARRPAGRCCQRSEIAGSQTAAPRSVIARAAAASWPWSLACLR